MTNTDSTLELHGGTVCQQRGADNVLAEFENSKLIAAVGEVTSQILPDRAKQVGVDRPGPCTAGATVQRRPEQRV